MTLSASQKLQRRNSLGGSDISAIFGLSKWSTPLQVYFSKQSEVEEIEHEEMTEAQEWGNVLEDSIIKMYEKRTGKKCIIPNPDAPPPLHPQHKCLHANVDALIRGEKTALEVKTARYAGDWGKPGTDEIPREYLLQVAHYSAVLGLEKVYISALIQGSELRFYEYIKNERLEATIVKKAVEWWERHIIGGEVPCPMNTSDALILWGKETEGLVKTVTPEISMSLGLIRNNKGISKNMDDVLEKSKTDVFNFMQDAETLIDENGNVLCSWKNQTANRFDSTRFEKEHPELYKQYLKQSSSRVFRLKEFKE